MIDIETWRDRHPAAHRPGSGEAEKWAADAERLRHLPPLVFAGECDLLRSRLAQAARGEAFLLQGGARILSRRGETANAVREEMRTLLQMSSLFTYAMSMPVVKMTGMPRVGDPSQMISVYQASASALNLVRAFASGGYADLREIHAWNRAFVADSPVGTRYERLAAQIGRALNFMEACGTRTEDLAGAEFFASHEARLLDYEAALTRIDSRTGHKYNTISHFVWCGSGGAPPEEALVDYLAEIRNPIGMVVGPSTGVDETLSALDRLDPEREAGRLTFVVRMGRAAMDDTFPTLIQKVTAQGHKAAWICDATHAGASEGADGRSGPRTFDDVLDGINGFFSVHRELATTPGGMHLELATPAVAGEPEPGLQRHSPLRPGGGPSAVPSLTRAGALDIAFMLADGLRAATR